MGRALGRDGSVGAGGDHLAQIFHDAVARRVDSRHLRAHLPVGLHIARRVQDAESPEAVRSRDLSDILKGLDAVHLFFFPGRLVFQAHAAKSSVSAEFGRVPALQDGDVFKGAELVAGDGIRLQIRAHRHGDGLRQSGQIDGLLHRGIAAAEHYHVLALAGRAVADGAEADAVSDVLILAGSSQRPGIGSRAQEHRAGRIDRILLFAEDRLRAVLLHPDLLHRLIVEGNAQLLGVLEHLNRQLRPAHRAHAGIVLNLIRIDNLAARREPVQHQYGQVGPDRVNGGCHTCRAAADNHQIIVCHNYASENQQ